MLDQVGGRLKFVRKAGFFFCIGVITAAGMLAAQPVDAFTDSYTFAGLQWGSSAAETTKHLRSQGFRVSRVVNGARREFVEQDAWGAFVKKDRGKRLLAKGNVSGEKIGVELVFGWNDRLERVIVLTPNWDGTPRGSKRMAGLADRITRQLEEQFGRTIEKQTPFGFVDTARWMEARDGSKMKLYIRGTNGFMFFPNDTTSLRVHFWNDRFQGPRDRRPEVRMADGVGNVPGAARNVMPAASSGRLQVDVQAEIDEK